MSAVKSILVIGAGELGFRVLKALSQHPIASTITISVLLRDSTVHAPSKDKLAALNTLSDLNIKIETGDIVTSSQTQLVSIFKNVDTVIGCTGFVAGPGLQTKLTNAVVEANVARYIPWQFGVDYDIVGRGSAQDLFDEQCDVRDILRAQSSTKWTIISTGMFTSFLFEPWFGVVDLVGARVFALGSLGNEVTVSAPEDISRLTAEAVLGGNADIFSNSVVFIGGDTITYEGVARLLEGHLGKKFDRHVLAVGDAKERLVRDPDNTILKYQIVFGEGRGVSWELEKTWNHSIGYRPQTTAEWVKDNIV
jgi:hypothetical protein